MRALLTVTAVVAALAFAGTAGAHPKPASWAGPVSLHKICVAVGACSDKRPVVRNAGVQPDEECAIWNIGKKVKVWDPGKNAYVIYICNCNPQGECRWWYLKTVHVKTVPWSTKKKRDVIDFQRACASIVCKKVGVWHSYRIKFVRPTR